MGEIKINDRFTIERDSDCWILTETKHGINRKTQEATERERQRYFPSLHTLVQFMVDLAPSEASSVQELVCSVSQIRDDIHRALLYGNKAENNAVAMGGKFCE